MEMKDIDLTKCVNCRFRVKDEDGDISGRIRVSERGTVYLFVDGQGNKGFLADRMQKMGITDFEIVPRDPETYKDWQVGDIIWDSHESGDNGRIIFRSGDFVAADIDGCRCYTCEELFDDGYRLVLTDIEQKIITKQIIEEKKKYEPQDGDIVAWKDKDDDGDPAISIYKDEFRYGEPVLVRNGVCENWGIASYCRSEGTMDKVYVGSLTAFFLEIIPYNERTMHLLGTMEDYKEGE